MIKRIALLFIYAAIGISVLGVIYSPIQIGERFTWGDAAVQVMFFLFLAGQAVGWLRVDYRWRYYAFHGSCQLPRGRFKLASAQQDALKIVERLSDEREGRSPSTLAEMVEPILVFVLKTSIPTRVAGVYLLSVFSSEPEWIAIPRHLSKERDYGKMTDWINFERTRPSTPAA